MGNKMPDKRKLFPSFNRLLALVRDGEITEEDLADGLFYFGCAREALEFSVAQAGSNCSVSFAFGLNNYKVIDDPLKLQDAMEHAKKVYVLIREAVFRAESEGRAVFRGLEKGPNYKQLNDLLDGNGIDVSSVKHLESVIYYHTRDVKDRYSGLVDVIV